jgi:hypothetical protein
MRNKLHYLVDMLLHKAGGDSQSRGRGGTRILIFGRKERVGKILLMMGLVGRGIVLLLVAVVDVIFASNQIISKRKKQKTKI